MNIVRGDQYRTPYGTMRVVTGYGDSGVFEIMRPSKEAAAMGYRKGDRINAHKDDQTSPPPRSWKKLSSSLRAHVSPGKPKRKGVHNPGGWVALHDDGVIGFFHLKANAVKKAKKYPNSFVVSAKAWDRWRTVEAARRYGENV